MKKTMLILLFVILLNCIFSITANSEENSLNLIIGTEGQFSQTNYDLIQQKISTLSSNLNLTDEQKQMAETIGRSSAKKINIYKVKFIDEKNKLITMKKNNASIREIQAQTILVRSSKAKINIIRGKNMREFEAILTQSQQNEFDKFKTELKQLIKEDNKLKKVPRNVKTREDSLKNLEN
jgi:hypothetical protein